MAQSADGRHSDSRRVIFAQAASGSNLEYCFCVAFAGF
jgi:hypothetical protein